MNANCDANCESCLKSMYYAHLEKREGFSTSDGKAKSLLLPPIMSFGHPIFPTFQNFGNFAVGQQIHKQEAYLQPFPPLLGLNMKFGDGEPVTFPRSKINFSIESITSDQSFSSSSSQPPTVVPTSIKEYQLQTELMQEKPAAIKSRGRPSADSLHILQQKSLHNPHRYQCPECSRSFPRKKSLDTHRLTHTDVKPYACDFPGCTRKFKQSGQLKTHLRLHTGEKPFHCTFPLCKVSFAHANRKCPHHPLYPLHRVSSEISSSNVFDRVISIHQDENIDTNKVKSWLEKQLIDRTKGEETTLNKLTSTTSKLNNILKSNAKLMNDIEEKHKITLDENNRRMLSAVALVELRDQMKSGKREHFDALFST